jgi:hypothetical protein
MFYYQTNGLKLQSDLKCKILNQTSPFLTSDIYIQKKKEIISIVNPKYEDNFQKISENIYEVVTPNKIKIQYHFPSQIHIENHSFEEEDEVTTYLLQVVLPIAMILHQKWPLHSCCIDFNGQGVLFGGVSGSGKSTFAMGMKLKGYTIFNDDISTIELKSGQAFVHSGYQQIKLLPESLTHFGYSTLDFEKVNDDFLKYRVELNEKLNSSEIPIKGIYFLEPENPENKLEIELLNGMNSLTYLIKNIFRVEVVKTINKSKQLFNQCSIIASTIPCFKVYRPKEMSPKDFHNYMVEKFTL